MVTENVDIRFRETGARVIKRKIDDIGRSADSATRGIFLMQRALFVLGGAGILRGLANQLDILTNYENRLRLTTTSSENLENVQRRLFSAANSSRSSFEAVAEIYTRTALSVRDLGISQAETIAFTERLSKATIISGASSREANAAMVQLGQGMASNTLRGDELRSVLEQLPFVADIISRSLGVTRGELRALGAEGKISAETILKAFREAGPEIDLLFAQTIPTISQSLQIFKNQVQEALAEFNKATGFSPTVASSIIAVGNALGEVVISATLAIAIFSGLFADKLARRVALATAGQISFSSAVKSGNIVLLDSAKAEVLRSTSLLESAKAEAISTAAIQSNLSAKSADLALQKASLEQTVLDTQFTVANGQARNITTGQFVGLATAKANLARVSQKLSIVEAAELAINTRLAGARVANAAATTTLTAATTRLAAASAAAGTVTARLAATFPLVTKAAIAAGLAIKSLFSFLIANPLTVALIAITGAAFALRNLRDASEEVNSVVDKTDALMFKVSESMAIAKKEGKTLAETFNEVSKAQLGLQRVEALDAQRAAIKAVADQLVGFNALWQDLKTIITFDSSFASAANQVSVLRDQLQNGSIDIFKFRDEISILAAETDNSRFTAFISGLVDSIDKVESSSDAVKILDALIATLNGTATASQTALLAMASGLDSVAGSADAAAGAVEFFIGKIPAMKAAAKVSNDLREASTQLSAGLADIDAQQRNGSISALDLISEQAKLNDLYRKSVSEIDGSAEATRKATSELDAYNNRAQLASRTGLDRTITGLTQNYEKLKASLIGAGASTEQLAQAEANFQTLVAGAKRDDRNKPSKKQPADFASILSGMNQEIELLSLSNKERSIQEGILGVEKELKRSLTDSEKELAAATLESVRAAQTQSEVLQGITGPRQDIMEQQAALNALFDQGRIGIEDYTTAIREMQVAADEASGTMFGGFRASINGAILSATELGSALGDIVVGAADSAADAIVEFAKTGKINIRDFFGDIFAQITKLIAKQLILKALGGLFGGFSGGGSIGPAAGLGFAGGGSINPSGPGSTDSQIVNFAKRPDERVDILTPGQQAAQKANLNKSQSAQIIQAPAPNVFVQIGSEDIADALSGEAGDRMIVNGLERNKSAVKSILS